MKNSDISQQHEFSAAPAVVKRCERCVICDGVVEPVIDLPTLPLTDTYCKDASPSLLPGIDQKLLYCKACGHGQLATHLAPELLYGNNYCFRTSASTTARKGTAFFLSVLDEVASGRHFRCALDLGCNDLFLLGLLKDRAEYRVGIDPVWQGREDERADRSIQVHGDNFEDIDLKSVLSCKPDLIVCRHTLEHIFDPRQVIRSLVDVAADDALFVFEMPCFDGLIRRFRFDQIFHQHAQYFTLASFVKLLEMVGGQYVLHRDNYHDWGAMAVVFVKGDAGFDGNAKVWPIDDIDKRYRLFQRQMRTTGELLSLYSDEPLYGYGAAQMLPVLGYHMGTDFSELAAVLDDDPAKDGIGYWNLPVRVMASAHAMDLADATVLITAVDNVQPIMKKLLSLRSRHIIYPFNVI